MYSVAVGALAVLRGWWRPVLLGWWISVLLGWWGSVLGLSVAASIIWWWSAVASAVHGFLGVWRAAARCSSAMASSATATGMPMPSAVSARKCKARPDTEICGYLYTALSR